MTEKRELEGAGYHYLDSNDDCLLVNQWIKRPEDLTGQAVSISKLLPRGVRCTNSGNRDGVYAGVPRGNPQVITFRFRIIVEIDKIAGK
jgi:hypothetical protein